MRWSRNSLLVIVTLFALIKKHGADIPELLRIDIGRNSPAIPPTATRGMVIDAGTCRITYVFIDGL